MSKEKKKKKKQEKEKKKRKTEKEIKGPRIVIVCREWTIRVV